MRNVPFDGWAKRDGVLEKFHPWLEATSAVSNAGLGAWTWSAYNNMSIPGSSTPAPFIPHGAHLALDILAKQAAVSVAVVEWEVATGAAGAEVPFARLPVAGLAGNIVNPGVDTNAWVRLGLTLPIGPTLIPSGTRVAHRMRVSTADPPWNIGVRAYLVGYDAAAPAAYAPYSYRSHLAGVHGAQTVNGPSGAVLANAPPGPSWSAWSGWTGGTNALPAGKDLLVWGVARTTTGSQQHIYLEFGTGALADLSDQQPRARVAFAAHSLGSVGLQKHLRPFVVKNGEYLAFRTRGVASANSFMFFWEEV